MAEPKFILLAKEPITLTGELANFRWKSRIDPPIRSSYLAICIAYLESLLRVKDVEIYRSSWAALSNCIKATSELVQKRPTYSNYWIQFNKIIESFVNKHPKYTPFQLLRLYAERNHLGACEALDASIRLIICVVTDKDFKFDEILTQPFNFRENRAYLEHFCNQLEVNFLIANETEHTYVSRSDKNKSPLVTLYMERDSSWSVLYHQEYEPLAAGQAGIGDLDRFPFVYDPRSEPVPNVRPLVSQTPTIPKANLEPQLIERSHQEPAIMQQSDAIPEETKQESSPAIKLHKAQIPGGLKKILPINSKNAQIPEEIKQEPPPQTVPVSNEVSQESSPAVKSHKAQIPGGLKKISSIKSQNAQIPEEIKQEPPPQIVPVSKEVSQEPSPSVLSPENTQEAEEVKQGSIYFSVVEENPKPEALPIIEISRQLISEMASTILLNCPNKCSDLLVKLLSDYIAIDPSVDHGEVVRLKENANKWKSTVQPPPILPVKKEASCGHQKLNFIPLCEEEHCAYCLKEIYKRDGQKALCSHGKKISPKNRAEIDKLIMENDQIIKDGIAAETIVQTEKKNDSEQEPFQAPSKALIMPEQPKKVDISVPTSNIPAINQGNIPHPRPIIQSNFTAGNNQPIKIINLGNDRQLSGDHEAQPKNDHFQPAQKIILQPSQLPPHPPQKIIVQSSQSQPNPLQDFSNPKIDTNFPQNMSHKVPDPVEAPPQVIHPEPNPPKPRNGLQCAACKEYKATDEFAISCPEHEICSLCRIKNISQCILCQRFYSKNDEETLEIIRISL